MHKPAPAPDRGGLPLNANAQPFVPGGGGGYAPAPESAVGAWQAQANYLAGSAGKRGAPAGRNGSPNMAPRPAHVTSPQMMARPHGNNGGGMHAPHHTHTHTPYGGAPGYYQPDAPMRTSPNMGPRPGGANGTPGSRPRSPMGGPQPHSTPPTLGMGRTMTYAKCPSGHELTKTTGSQLVSNGAGGLVVCGGVFCRRCDKENLDEDKERGYFTCPQCNWDCCIDCVSTLPWNPAGARTTPPVGKFAAPPVPAMAPLPQSVAPPPGLKNELLTAIRTLLQALGEDEPFGMAGMPTDKLVTYETHLRKKVEQKYPSAPAPGAQGQKVAVTKEAAAAAAAAQGADGAPKAKPFAVGDRVMFVGGGRFPGNKRWKDGATLTLGEVGEVIEIDPKQKWSLKVQFERVYVMLMEADVDLLPDTPKHGKKHGARKDGGQEAPKKVASNARSSSGGGAPAMGASGKKRPHVASPSPADRRTTAAAAPSAAQPAASPAAASSSSKDKDGPSPPAEPAPEPTAKESAAPAAAASSDASQPPPSVITVPLLVATATLALGVWFLYRAKRRTGRG